MHAAIALGGGTSFGRVAVAFFTRLIFYLIAAIGDINQATGLVAGIVFSYAVSSITFFVSIFDIVAAGFLRNATAPAAAVSTTALFAWVIISGSTIFSLAKFANFSHIIINPAVAAGREVVAKVQII